ncbi:MAG: hypothetical protein CMJ78_27305 [Planctomycetaceae bacterium]|nr:hypothetical protein [Planctomycetaceae bacterium]
MRPPRFTILKNVTWAFIALLLLFSAIETGLTVYDYKTGKITSGQASQFVLVAPSWANHHSLKPLHRVTVRSESRDPVVVATNSFGLRGSEPQMPKPSGQIRILCLGDEAVFAKDVDIDNSFAHRLQANLREQTGLEIEVINAGIPGYCPLLACLQLRHELLSLQPDLVIMNFDMSDVADDRQLRRHVLTDQSNRPKACPHPSLIRGEKVRSSGSLADHFATVGWIQNTVMSNWTTDDATMDFGDRYGKYAWLSDSPPDWSIYIQHSFEPIEDIAQLTASIDSDFLLATYPVPWQVSPTASNSAKVRARADVPQDMVFNSNLPFELLDEFAQSRRHSFCNAAPSFRSASNPDELYLDDSPQFSTAGHQLYANVLTTHIMTKMATTLRVRDQSVPSPRAALRLDR